MTTRFFDVELFWKIRTVFFTALFCGLHMATMVAAETLTLKDGSSIEVETYLVRGAQVSIKTKYGTSTLPVASLDSKTAQRLQFPRQAIALSSMGHTTNQKTPVMPLTKTPTGQGVISLVAGQYRLSYVSPAKMPFKCELVPDNVKPRFSVRERQFTVRYHGKDFRVQAYLPVGTDGRVVGSIKDILYYGHYNAPNLSLIREKKAPQNEKTKWGINETLRELTIERAIPVFTVLFNYEGIDVDDQERCFYYAPSGAFDVIKLARNQMLKELGISTCHLFLIGLSGGATQVERYALENPSEVTALVTVGAARFQSVTKRIPFPMLVLHTRGDPRERETKPFVEEARSWGNNVIYRITAPRNAQRGFSDDPNYHHVYSAEALNLCKEFIVGVQTQGSEISRWPFRVSNREPVLLSSNPISIPPNLVSYSYFPSMRFKELWLNSKYQSCSIYYGKAAGELQELKITAAYPSGPPRRVAMLIAGREISSAELGDLADYLCTKGFICVTGDYPNAELDRLQAVKYLVQWVVRQDFAQKLPLSFLGFTRGGSHLLLADGVMQNLQRDTAIYTLNSPLEWPFKPLSPMANVATLRVRARLFVSLSHNGSIQQEAETYVSRATQMARDVQVKRLGVSKNPSPCFDFVDAVLAGGT